MHSIVNRVAETDARMADVLRTADARMADLHVHRVRDHRGSVHSRLHLQNQCLVRI